MGSMPCGRTTERVQCSCIAINANALNYIHAMQDNTVQWSGVMRMRRGAVPPRSLVVPILTAQALAIGTLALAHLLLSWEDTKMTSPRLTGGTRPAI